MPISTLIRAAIGVLAGHGIPSPRLDAELIVAHAAGISRETAVSFGERTVDRSVIAAVETMLDDRTRFRPLQYILGRAHFWDFVLEVDERVLIPRPESEMIVERLRQLYHPGFSGAILDLCTGSGCLAIACARQFPESRVTAVELSGHALQVARRNAVLLDAPVEFVQGDLISFFAAKGSFDVIVSNPPYVSAREYDTLEPNVRCFEPELALTGLDNPDGFGYARRIIDGIHHLLNPSGFAMIETNETVARHRDELAARARKYAAFSIEKDYAGKERYITLRK